MPVPIAIRKAALRRFRETQPARVAMVQNDLEGRALQAQGDPEALTAWITSMGVEPATAAALIRGEQAAVDALTDLEKCQLKTVLPTTDFRPIRFMEKARLAADAVGRVVSKGGVSRGTFFMISPSLLMTANHVLEDPDVAGKRFAEFAFELDVNGQARTPIRFSLDPGTFFAPNPTPELDYTVVALGQPVAAGATPTPRRFCPLLKRGMPHDIGTFVNIIQHPEQERKQVVFRENRLVCLPGPLLFYMADTKGGSSGAPVFNDEWEVVGMHRFAKRGGTLDIGNGLTFPDQVNEGVAMASIVAALRAQLPTLPAQMQPLLTAALAL